MKQGATAVIGLLAACCCAPCGAQNTEGFKDVPPDHWAYQAVTDLKQRGILVGYPDGLFHGERTLTRNEFAKGFDRWLMRYIFYGDYEGPPGLQGKPGKPGPQGARGPVPPGLDQVLPILEAIRQELKSLKLETGRVRQTMNEQENEIHTLNKQTAAPLRSK